MALPKEVYCITNKTKNNLYDFFVKHCQFAWKIVDFQSLKALRILRFLDHFYEKKSCDRLVHWTRDKYRLKLKGRFFLFLLSYLPLFFYSYIMSYDKKCHKDHVLWTFCVNGGFRCSNERFSSWIYLSHGIPLQHTPHSRSRARTEHCVHTSQRLVSFPAQSSWSKMIVPESEPK